MKVEDFDYKLPECLIAQHPSERRSEARMLVVERATGRCEPRTFAAFPEYVRAGDCLVRNNTRVLAARLFGRRDPTGGRVEVFLLEETCPGRWRCFLRPGRRLRPGQRVILEPDGNLGLRVTDHGEGGTFEVDFECDDVHGLLERAGRVPLPPYIRREPSPSDRERYQTVYATHPGAVAAPTAGLHFTPEILAEVEARGVRIVDVTLHVGAGTFQPVSVDTVEEHIMHEETYEVTPEAAAAVNACRAGGGRVFAVGTTAVRTLETVCASETGRIEPGSGRTNIFLHPPHRPRVVDGLLTNFHLPRSTLLMLVATFCPRDRILAAYRLAVRERFRFYSYGDCMLLLPGEGT